jgi:hypothetical protein
MNITVIEEKGVRKYLEKRNILHQYKKAKNISKKEIFF